MADLYHFYKYKFDTTILQIVRSQRRSQGWDSLVGPGLFLAAGRSVEVIGWRPIEVLFL